MSVFTTVPTQRSHAFVIEEIIREILIKIIKAIDLAVQRLQNVTIYLQDAQKDLENAMSKLKLKEISEWSEKQRKIFETYYSELQKVKAAIAYYKRIKSIITQQANLLEEYKKSYQLFKKDKHFSAEKLVSIGDVYTGMVDQSVKNLDEILLVINSFTTQMPDAARLKIIDQAAARIDKNIADLRAFTNGNIVYSLHMAKDEIELSTLKAYYGLDK
ncbi:conjugal transfer protein TraI [[Flexibacter] sp. ATCC 35208]|uniref:conjugal transfer protein TraI n=1 Tax=[Flexibacter] sp. ATCC 35208 TaxID=1936242 RepID=UPI00117D7059|nr:conjugal transfer protein TraI [[Flexibacter] sp. ATCC 35208]